MNFLWKIFRALFSLSSFGRASKEPPESVGDLSVEDSPAVKVVDSEELDLSSLWLFGVKLGSLARLVILQSLSIFLLCFLKTFRFPF